VRTMAPPCCANAGQPCAWQNWTHTSKRIARKFVAWADPVGCLRETSLIVLDNVADHVHNEIEPPRSLRAEYECLLALQNATRQKAHIHQTAKNRGWRWCGTIAFSRASRSARLATVVPAAGVEAVERGARVRVQASHPSRVRAGWWAEGTERSVRRSTADADDGQQWVVSRLSLCSKADAHWNVC
jgi:hypothetical protein